MKYYITADIHGFYTEFHKALEETAYFTDPEPHKLIILGDIFDRGQEAVEMQRFILSLLEQDLPLLFSQIQASFFLSWCCPPFDSIVGQTKEKNECAFEKTENVCRLPLKLLYQIRYHYSYQLSA